MATPNILATLQAALTATNNLLSPSPYLVNYNFQNPTYGANVSLFEPYLQVVGTVTVTLPNPPVYVLMIQNLAPAGQANSGVTVAYGANSISIGPQGLWCYMDPAKLLGVSTLNLTALSGGTIPCMVFAAV